MLLTFNKFLFVPKNKLSTTYTLFFLIFNNSSTKCDPTNPKNKRQRCSVLIQSDNTNILVGENTHWRTVKESLLTFLTSKKMIEKHFEKLMDMATNQSDPFEKNLHQIYEKEKCFSPIPSLSIHCTNINSVFGLSPNIDLKKLWEDNKN